MKIPKFCGKFEISWQKANIFTYLVLSELISKVFLVFVLGGQPGAGKAELIKQILVTFGDNFVVINGDEFRKMHPNFNELKIKYRKDYPKYTADFTRV